MAHPERIRHLPRLALPLELTPVIIAVTSPDTLLGQVVISQNRTRFVEGHALLDLFGRQGRQLGAEEADSRTLGFDQEATFFQALTSGDHQWTQADLDDFALLTGRRWTFPASRFHIDDQDVIEAFGHGDGLAVVNYT